MRYVKAPQSDKQIEWAKKVKVGVTQPGLDGTLWRLFKHFPVEEVGPWITGEVLRGSPLGDIADSVTIMLASCITQLAARRGRDHAVEFAAKILSRTAGIVHQDMIMIVGDEKAVETMMGLKPKKLILTG